MITTVAWSFLTFAKHHQAEWKEHKCGNLAPVQTECIHRNGTWVWLPAHIFSRYGWTWLSATSRCSDLRTLRTPDLWCWSELLVGALLWSRSINCTVTGLLWCSISPILFIWAAVVLLSTLRCTWMFFLPLWTISLQNFCKQLRCIDMQWLFLFVPHALGSHIIVH